MLFPQDEICNWLCEEMTRDEIDVSQVDMAGNTPLHLAAREGRLLTISALLQHGAKVHLKVGGRRQTRPPPIRSDGATRGPRTAGQTSEMPVFVLQLMRVDTRGQGGNSIALKKGPKKGPKVNLLQAYE